MKEPNYNRKGKEKENRNKSEERPNLEIRKYDANILENIGRDGEMYSLNDLWNIAGCPLNKDPRQWQRLPQPTEFINSASKILNVGLSHIIKARRGKGGGTYGVRQIALEYAQYLDPDLAVLVNEVFFQRVEEDNNPDLIGKRYYDAYKKRGKSTDWIATRLKSIDTRHTFTDTLKNHEVSGTGYRDCTNAIYRPLYGGNANLIRERKKLGNGASLRDNMTRTELIAVELAESLATDNIEKKDVRGNKKCTLASENTSQCVAIALNEYKRRIAI